MEVLEARRCERMQPDIPKDTAEPPLILDTLYVSQPEGGTHGWGKTYLIF